MSTNIIRCSYEFQFKLQIVISGIDCTEYSNIPRSVRYVQCLGFIPGF